MDAIRIRDGKFMMLKRLKKSKHPYEVEISQFFSTESLASNPANHCVPILEVLQIPDDEDMVILVMPLLRSFDDPRFDTYGEVVECFKQLFIVIFFKHAYVHCNLMMSLGLAIL